MKTRQTLKINRQGNLEIGGCDTTTLASAYGTPLYVMDEEYIVEVCKSYTSVLERLYPDSLVCFASKAFSCKAIYSIVKSCGLGADVVSGCELETALRGGMTADKIYFHGNNKLSSELKQALSVGVNTIVIDSIYEIDLLNEIAKEQKLIQNVMVRVNPGIDAHTHQFIQTTKVDSKFGFSIADGAAISAIAAILKKPNLKFNGIHCHIGSQIFELKPFILAVDKMTDFIKEINNMLKVNVNELNMGGGYGVTYTSEDKPLAPYEYVEAIVRKLCECIEYKKIKSPKLILEPGRSIVGEAGITLYTIGAIKDIKNVKKYLSVDGGMFENPRFALYQAKYDGVIANKASQAPCEVVTVAGKCCESGDMIINDVKLPVAESGDILAVFTTGAYNYSMASNYNRNPIPPVVLVNKGKSCYIVKPQTYEDIMSRDTEINMLGGK